MAWSPLLFWAGGWKTWPISISPSYIYIYIYIYINGNIIRNLEKYFKFIFLIIFDYHFPFPVFSQLSFGCRSC